MPPARTRHIVLWLTVAAYMITCMDRVVISAAVPPTREEFGFDKIAITWFPGAFRSGYAFFRIPGGAFLPATDAGNTSVIAVIIKP